ncbi:class I SAM-dependent methyltransferase [Mucilaginibacter angelicae]|uniref:Class I SAM-dependent methyltransferase n=1 Tax=Mucilaginibacter angelicae TaxID=869718 RepID=A0ABV6L777_9SPHI
MNTWDEHYKNFWNERYKQTGYAYGKEPNDFFAAWLRKLKPGAILMPADGEGRNGVFAAKLGWDVTSFDLSEEGKEKALELAKENDVTIKYLVGDQEQLSFETAAFDAIGLIYAHFAAGKKSSFHKELSSYLKPGGVIVFEAFGKNNLHNVKINPKVGGPKDVGMLFSTDEIAADFEGYNFLVLEETEVDLGEGDYHIGTGSVVRFVGRKPRV